MPPERQSGRNRLSAQERRLRSRAVKLLADAPLLHASLIERMRRCGRPSCHCASPDSEGHFQLYLYRTREGRLHQQYVPRALHEDVRQWVANDLELRQLLEKLWALSWQRVASATGRRRRADTSNQGEAGSKGRSSDA